ncbi:hypothetical protein K435DRAFT_855038 [Dendrothele bispora CBS 962.96]|uniref:Uncharacterized protein n=1 Tax=Dendrothele bispora (strain CBS 962.96) TaxID=1314807 RepID=A0A4S8MC25_DENBC|nr:hypothetical protein K435DRAFT_855038 [Dendrothele bispora CBS 962.96]
MTDNAYRTSENTTLPVTPAKASAGCQIVPGTEESCYGDGRSQMAMNDFSDNGDIDGNEFGTRRNRNVVRCRPKEGNGRARNSIVLKCKRAEVVRSGEGTSESEDERGKQERKSIAVHKLACWKENLSLAGSNFENAENYLVHWQKQIRSNSSEDSIKIDSSIDDPDITLVHDPDTITTKVASPAASSDAKGILELLPKQCDMPTETTQKTLDEVMEENQFLRTSVRDLQASLGSIQAENDYLRSLVKAQHQFSQMMGVQFLENAGESLCKMDQQWIAYDHHNADKQQFQTGSSLSYTGFSHQLDESILYFHSLAACRHFSDSIQMAFNVLHFTTKEQLQRAGNAAYSDLFQKLVEAEADAKAKQQLIDRLLNSNITPPFSLHTPSPAPSLPSSNRLPKNKPVQPVERAMCPNIKFYTLDSWNKYKEVKKGTNDAPAKLGYLQKEDGQYVSAADRTAMTTESKRLFNEFYWLDVDPVSWGLVTPSVAEYYCSQMVTRFPFLAMCNDGCWKTQGPLTFP